MEQKSFLPSFLLSFFSLSLSVFHTNGRRQSFTWSHPIVMTHRPLKKMLQTHTGPETRSSLTGQGGVTHHVTTQDCNWLHLELVRLSLKPRGKPMWSLGLRGMFGLCATDTLATDTPTTAPAFSWRWNGAHNSSLTASPKILPDTVRPRLEGKHSALLESSWWQAQRLPADEKGQVVILTLCFYV